VWSEKQWLICSFFLWLVLFSGRCIRLEKWIHRLRDIWQRTRDMCIPLDIMRNWADCGPIIPRQNPDHGICSSKQRMVRWCFKVSMMRGRIGISRETHLVQWSSRFSRKCLNGNGYAGVASSQGRSVWFDVNLFFSTVVYFRGRTVWHLQYEYQCSSGMFARGTISRRVWLGRLER